MAQAASSLATKVFGSQIFLAKTNLETTTYRKKICSHGSTNDFILSKKAFKQNLFSTNLKKKKSICNAVDSSTASTTSNEKTKWIPMIPIEALPKGDRRLVRQGGLTILLLWYRNEIYAVESTSPAEGAYSEGFVNAKLTQDGCIICPTTNSTYDLKTGVVREWYPNNPVLRMLTPSLRDMRTFPVKVDDYQICIGINKSPASMEATEVVFKGKIRVGQTASDVAVDETRMVVDESEGGFGFSSKNELVNGRAAMIGFVMLLIIEVTTGKGLLGTTGFLDFLYRNGVPSNLLG